MRKKNLPKSLKRALHRAIVHMRKTGEQLFSYQGKGPQPSGCSPKEIESITKTIFDRSENPTERTITHHKENFVDLTTFAEFEGHQLEVGAFINGETLWWMKLHRAPKNHEIIRLA